MKRLLLILMVIWPLTVQGASVEQDQLAATLEVLAGSVTVQRVNTTNPIEIRFEAVVGVGDIIRTDDEGRARITFFADGTDTEILPNSEYRIDEFNAVTETDFTLSASVLLGQTRQRLGRILSPNSSYDVSTPSMTLAARGTEFDIRVEVGGRAAMLVTSGAVNAATDDEATASVESEFGIRADSEAGLSDVVRASTFEELDAALDGCIANVTGFDDTRINVRVGPSRDLPRVGTISAEEIERFFGTVTSQEWYRIEFRGGFGWILASGTTINEECARLREFTTPHVEDPSLYAFLGDPIEIDLDDLSASLNSIAPAEDAEAEADEAEAPDETDSSEE